MQTSIDKFGRVLIPKSIRDHLGVKPGTAVQVLEHDHEILIKLIKQRNPIQNQDGILIFTGEAAEDIESVLQKERDKRIEDLW